MTLACTAAVSLSWATGLSASGAGSAPGDGGAQKQLAALFQEAISKAYPDLNVPALIAPTNQPEHGDYQCNNAMSLFGRLKGKVSSPSGTGTLFATASAGSLASLCQQMSSPCTIMGGMGHNKAG